MDTNDIEILDGIIRHIQNVQSNGIILSKKLIENGEDHLGRLLLYNIFEHDKSKFLGTEWEHLKIKKTKKLKVSEKNGFLNALDHHQKTNPHHSEYWGGIENMPNVYIAEMVCDWAARAREFGSDIREWIDNDAIKRYNFKKNDAVYNNIFKYVNLLYDKPFEAIK